MLLLYNKQIVETDSELVHYLYTLIHAISALYNLDFGSFSSSSSCCFNRTTPCTRQVSTHHISTGEDKSNKKTAMKG